MEYSVVIRTLGTAGEKYQQTLNSIASQTIKAKEIIVVLPFGYNLPPERLGYEKFIFSPKGMVNQRVVGFNSCTTELILALDDDVYFEPTFIEEMTKTLQTTDADFVSPIVRDLPTLTDSAIPKPNIKKKILNIKNWLIGISYKKALKNNFIIVINNSGGFTVNTNIQPNIQYYNQSGHGTCLFGKTQKIKEIHFEDELWLEDTKYALPEDMVMFYKLYLYGNKNVMNPDVKFIHLDAGSSLINEDKKINNVFASARNGYIFWYKFVYQIRKKKFITILSMTRRIFFTCFFSFIKGAIKFNLKYFRTYVNAYIDGYKYVKSPKYKSLNIKNKQ